MHIRTNWLIILLLIIFTAGCQESPNSFLKTKSNPEPKTEAERIESQARKQTVLITGKNTGTGVIVGQENSVYYVLTSRHVIATKPSENIELPPNLGPDEQNLSGKEDPYKIVTYDGQTYEIDYEDVFKDPKYDLAIFKFNTASKSKRIYPVAKFSDAPLSKNQTVYIYGFKNCFKKARDTREEFNSGIIKSTNKSPDANQGYSIYYSNPTVVGMSGSPVLDTTGRIIAIHGKTGPRKNELLKRKGDSLDCSPLNESFGNNYGISTKTFKNSDLASKFAGKFVFDGKVAQKGNSESD